MNRAEELDRHLEHPIRECAGTCDPVGSVEGDTLLCEECWPKVPRPARQRIHTATRALRNKQDDDTRMWLRRAQLAAIDSLGKGE